MTAIEAGAIQFPIPPQGLPIPLNEALPAPAIKENAKSGHEIEIYTSRDPVLGKEVETLCTQLHAEVYLSQGFISEEEIGPLGLYRDQYTDRSTHFYAINGRKVAAARQISCAKTGLSSLPTVENFVIDPEVIKKVADVKYLSQIKAREAVEISGLASRKKAGESLSNLDAVVSLYSKMIANSLEQGHKLWLLNVDPSFLRQLTMLLGEEQVHVLGDKHQYKGPATIPVALNPQDILRHVFASSDPTSQMIQEHFKEVLPGINDKRIPADIRQLLRDNGIETKHYPAIMRVLTNPKVIGQTAIMAYSASRAFPAANVDEFHGSVAALWGIDVATSIPYAWGVMEAFTGKTIPRRVSGAIVGAASFLAPYAYFYKQGNAYPIEVNLVVSGFIGLAVLNQLVMSKSRSKKEAKLTQIMQSANLQNTKP